VSKDTDRGKKYASSTDVARLAGVSQSAVSRSYQAGGRVSAATRQKVLTAAAELDYRPSLIPRIMKTHRSNLVAVVIGGMYNPFYSQVLEQFTVRLQQTGHHVLLVHVDSGHTLDAIVPRLASYRVDAIVSALAILSDAAAAELARLRIPVVSFNTPIRNEFVSSVCSDNAEAGAAAAELFVSRGAAAFGFIAGPAGSPASEERLAGFRAGLRRHGIRRIAIGHGAFRYEGGFAAAEAMFRRPDRPDALFCANDLSALGAIDAIRAANRLLVPRDVLVAGFDDIAEAAWHAYDLTTFVQDAPRMVDEALAILAAGMSGARPAGNICRVVPARLVERGSTAVGRVASIGGAATRDARAG
jgi:DNA-binding LacI/PurR family transcriptional regulator